MREIYHCNEIAMFQELEQVFYQGHEINVVLMWTKGKLRNDRTDVLHRAGVH